MKREIVALISYLPTTKRLQWSLLKKILRDSHCSLKWAYLWGFAFLWFM